MFAIGDMVVYPLHGAGKIVTIEDRLFEGRPTPYIVLDMLANRLRVCIPLQNAERLGLREVCGIKVLDDVGRALQSGEPFDFNHVPWNRRAALYIGKLRSGNIMDVALVIRSLALQEHARHLSSGEKRMLASAREILQSEVQVVKQCDRPTAAVWVDKNLNIE